MTPDDPLARLSELSEMPRSEIGDAIRSECVRDLRPQKSLTRSQRLAASALLVAAGTTLLSVVGKRAPDTSSAALTGAAAWSVAMAVVLLVGLGHVPGKRPGRPIALALALGLPLLFLLVLGLDSTRILPIGEFFGTGQLARALPCFVHSFACGVGVSGGILLLWSRTDPFRPGVTGALVGLLGGLAGAVGVGLVCPSHEAWHLWMGHGLTVLALVLLGSTLGRRWLSP